MRARVLSGIVVCLTFFHAAIAFASQALDLQPKVDPLAQPLIDEGVAVGFVVGVYQEGETQIIGYGEIEKGRGEAPGGDTVYEIGSVSKAFTGTLLADLVQQGVVKLEDELQKLLPDDVKAPMFENTPITLEHLATHTSGLPRLPDNMGFWGIVNPWNPYANYTVEKMYAFLRTHQLRRGPGKYEYSNLGMGLLGHLLARQQDSTYEKLLIDRIAEPLDMHDTRIDLSGKQKDRLAPPFDSALNLANNWDIPTLAGAGGIRSTAADMLKFVAANLGSDDQPPTKSLKLAHEKRHTMDDGLAMGLGWHIARDGVTRWHNGMTGGYASWLAVVPDRKVGVVVLSNTATMKITELGEQITRVACGIEVKPPAKREVVSVDAATLESYAGTYAITPQFALTVTVEDGKLMVQATGQHKFEVFAELPTEFFYKVVDAQLTFEKGEDGKVNRLILHQNGRDMPAERQ